MNWERCSFLLDPGSLRPLARGFPRALAPASGMFGLILYLLLPAGSGCSHDQVKVMRELDDHLSRRIGRASREEIAAFLGEPEVKDSIGQSEVWVYQLQNAGAANRVPAALKEIINYYDEVIMTFDSGGILQRYTLVLFGHGSKSRRK